MATETVYVELLDEGVDVWRPVEAEALGGGRYRLIAPADYDPEIETWAFLPGAVVRCSERILSEGPTIVAVEEVRSSGTSRLKTWGRWIGYTLLVLVAVAPWPYIAWGRATRAASAPAVLEEVFRQGNGRFTVGAYSFTVDGRMYRDEDAGPTVRRGERTWSRDDLDGMHVCYDPDRPGEDLALTPPHYRCGDPNIFTSDGGW